MYAIGSSQMFGRPQVKSCYSRALAAAIAMSPDGRYIAAYAMHGRGHFCLCDTSTGNLAKWQMDPISNVMIDFDAAAETFICRGTEVITIGDVERMRHVAWAVSPETADLGLPQSLAAYDMYTTNVNGACLRLAGEEWLYASRRGWAMACPPDEREDNTVRYPPLDSRRQPYGNIIPNFLVLSGSHDHVVGYVRTGTFLHGHRVEPEKWAWKEYIDFEPHLQPMFAVGGSVAVFVDAVVYGQDNNPSRRFVTVHDLDRPAGPTAHPPLRGTPVINALAVSPDGSQYAVSHNLNGQVSTFDSRTGKLIRTLKWGNGAISALRYSDDGLVLAGLGLNGLIVWDND